MIESLHIGGRTAGHGQGHLQGLGPDQDLGPSQNPDHGPGQGPDLVLLDPTSPGISEREKGNTIFTACFMILGFLLIKHVVIKDEDKISWCISSSIIDI